jgi:hypothetical protein
MRHETALKKSLKWINNNLEHFNPLSKINDMDIISVNKPYVELHLMLWIANRNKDFISEENLLVIEKISKFAQNILLSPSYYEQILIKPENIRINGATMMFYLNYNSNKILEDILKRVYPVAIKISPELTPFRKMDLEYSLQLVDKVLGRDEIKNMSSLAENTILGTDIDMINYTIDDEYALTHSLFYLTDFGEKSISHKKQDIIEHSILTLCVKNMLIGDMDLLGEYIINILNLNIETDICKIAFMELLNSQNRDGYFPGPERGKKHEIKNNSKDLFRVNYHTTLVAIMAIIFYTKKYGNEN